MAVPVAVPVPVIRFSVECRGGGEGKERSGTLDIPAVTSWGVRVSILVCVYSEESKIRKQNGVGGYLALDWGMYI